MLNFKHELIYSNLAITLDILHISKSNRLKTITLIADKSIH